MLSVVSTRSFLIVPSPYPKLLWLLMLGSGLHTSLRISVLANAHGLIAMRSYGHIMRSHVPYSVHLSSYGLLCRHTEPKHENPKTKE